MAQKFDSPADAVAYAIVYNAQLAAETATTKTDDPT
jgi:hypothetical protein